MNDSATYSMMDIEYPEQDIRPDPRRRWVVLTTILLLVVPLVFSAAKRETARWYHAAALEALYSSDSPQALELVQKGLKWSPNDVNLLSQSANVHLKMTQATAAAEASDRVLEIAQSDYDLSPNQYNLAPLASALNLSAYSHALDESNLEESLERANRAIELVGPVGEIVDTRGYLHYLLGNYEEAVEDTELAVASFTNTLARSKSEVRQKAPLFVDQRRIQYRLDELDQSMAVFLQHRGLAYEAVGRSEEANEDFEEAEKLGFDPQQGVW